MATETVQFQLQFSHSVVSMDCSTPGLPVHPQLPEPTQTHVHHVGNAIQPSHPLSSPSPPTFNLSQHQGVFQWVSSLHQMAKVFCSFSFSISPSNEYSGLISFRIGWFDLLTVQGTLKSLLQHNRSKSINSLALSLLYGPALTSIYDYWKSIALTIWTFVGKVMSLLFKGLSLFVIAFLPRSIF